MKTKHLRLMQRAYVILFFCFMYLPIAYITVLIIVLFLMSMQSKGEKCAVCVTAGL